MERNYWLARQRASFMLAGAATSAEDRLIQYHLAGIHSVKAAARSPIEAINDDGPLIPHAADSLPPQPNPSAVLNERYYRELAQGAAYLASTASDEVQAAEHARMARNYARRAREAVWGKGRSK